MSRKALWLPGVLSAFLLAGVVTPQEAEASLRCNTYCTYMKQQDEIKKWEEIKRRNAEVRGEVPASTSPQQPAPPRHTPHMKSTWEHLVQLGVEQYIGQTVGGVYVDEGAALAGAIAVGADLLMDYLSGQDSMNDDPSLRSGMLGLMSEYSGTDVSSVTGRHNTRSQLAGKGYYGATELSEQVGMYCDPQIASIQMAAAESEVEEKVALAMSDEAGFTTLDGSGVNSSVEGLDGGGQFIDLTCLERLLNSGLDVMFNPPGMSQMNQSLEDLACQQAQAVYSAVLNKVNQTVFSTANMGGFFPGGNMGNLGGSVNVAVRPGAGGFGQVNVHGPEGRQTVVESAKVPSLNELLSGETL